jgi:hypothetical protein
MADSKAEPQGMRRDNEYQGQVAELAKLTGLPPLIVDLTFGDMCSPHPEKQDEIIEHVLSFHRILKQF